MVLDFSDYFQLKSIDFRLDLLSLKQTNKQPCTHAGHYWGLGLVYLVQGPGLQYLQYCKS